jgi:hypothetical protein
LGSTSVKAVRSRKSVELDDVLLDDELLDELLELDVELLLEELELLLEIWTNSV